MLTDKYTAHINTHREDANIMTKDLNAAISKTAAGTIPGGAKKNYRPYWIEEPQQLENDVSEA